MAADGNKEAMRLGNILASNTNDTTTEKVYQPPPISEKTQKEIAADVERFMRNYQAETKSERPNSGSRTSINARTESASPRLSTQHVRNESSSPQHPAVDSGESDSKPQIPEANGQPSESKPDLNSGNGNRKHE